jgi:2-polyprenyl-3-methyl-5-hydroxy-6-metoxy-1,4-benzoquinol methylase
MEVYEVGLKYSLGTKKGGTHGIILKLSCDGTKVLDVGCASGYLGRELNQAGAAVWGCDFDAHALNNVPIGVYEDLKIINLHFVPSEPLFYPQLFDVVIAADVLEHLLEPDRILSVLTESLELNGIIIVSLPNVAHFSTRISLLLGRFHYTETGILDRTHLHLYTYKSARELIEGAGLEVVGKYAGSNVFGSFLNSFPFLLKMFGGMLAYNIIYVCQRNEIAVT